MPNGSRSEAIVTSAGGLRAVPRGIWGLEFVCLLMDISSEMIHSLLPLFLTSVLRASALWAGNQAGCRPSGPARGRGR